MRSQKNKSFERWASLSSDEMKAALLRAADVLTVLPVSEGFYFPTKYFDSVDPPPYSIRVQRPMPFGITQYISIGFEKRHRTRFQVHFGSKESASPYGWKRAGALVWKGGSELDKYRWWGTKWWQPNSVAKFNRDVDRVALLIPQAIDFLETGIAGENVFSVPITGSLPDRP